MEYFKISDLSKRIGKHVNTVDGWFKQLEEKRIHYVNRINGEKVYDSLDLSIGTYIRDKREQKWVLDAIFNELPEAFEMRPFPPDMESTSVPQVVDIEQIKQSIRQELMLVVDEIAATRVDEIKTYYEEIIRRLPEASDPTVEREKRINDLITQRRVEIQLEKEALDLWSKKPEAERKKRVGLFRKEEDLTARDRFIKDYIEQYYEMRLREEYRL